jgi:hypothetical protein
MWPSIRRRLNPLGQKMVPANEQRIEGLITALPEQGAQASDQTTCANQPMHDDPA